MLQYITKFDSPNFTREQDSLAVFGARRLVTGFVGHHWGDPATNPTFDGVVNYLCRRNGTSSAHLVIEAGRAAWLVDAKDVAWHAGGYANPRTIGMELNPRAWDSDYATAAEVLADLRNVYGNHTLFSHDYFMNTQCPGKWDMHRLDAMSYPILKKKYGKVF